MVERVTDARSNANDQVMHAVGALGRSAHRRQVFEAVCFGKKRVKTVQDVADATGLTRKQVLNAAKALVHDQVIHQTTKGGETAYEKDSFLCGRRKEIFGLIDQPERQRNFPTKTNPQLGVEPQIHISVPSALVRVEHLTVDEIGSFSKVQDVPRGRPPTEVSESDFKAGLLCILRQGGDFKDWGGELNDAFSTHLEVDGRRLRTAFALKGPGTRGKLTPKKMGKNGDQIQRLLSTSADVYVLQYWNAIEQSVYEQVHQLAMARSAGSGTVVRYVIIDGSDSTRLIEAYPECFPTTGD